MSHMEAFPVPSESPLLSAEEETQRWDASWSQDGDLQGCGQLERKWLLWQDFMTEQAHLDAWLRLAEQAVGSSGPVHFAYVIAKEDLSKFERLRCEAGPRLVQLDGLTRRNRTLTRLFRGAMQARLLAAARECGHRWDEVNAKLESITGRLKLFVSEWEGLEAEREELALWLADLDVRLTEVDHLTGNTCKKLRQLQVFEDDWILSQATDSGCPSESLLEEEGALDKAHLGLPAEGALDKAHLGLPAEGALDKVHLGLPAEGALDKAHLGLPAEGALDKAHLGLPAFPNPPKAFSLDFGQSSCPPSPPSPTHEHLGLEWDPSVDIGRSVSRDDADSSYFSASAGICHRGGVKRRSYLSSLGSQSDLSNDITNQEAGLRLEGWLDHAHPSVSSPVAAQRGGTRPEGDQWATSTPDSRDGEPIGFDGRRVRAWLGDTERRTSCSKAVQTDAQVECHLDGSHINALPFLALSPSPSHDLKASPDWLKHVYPLSLQAEEEEAERRLSEQSETSSSKVPSSLLSPALLCLLLATALALLSCLIWAVLEPPCQRSGRMPRSFHLTLTYVNGPPPT
ncbi:nesprin-2 isoform X3 [Perca flavescens]|uniref:nesprin-2 isoform X3 n=1 Tax=Perca flavescens TaxID=8167 RepID=UPI00106E86C2|nr:nesprin-2-like isoform X3 [Perca flavescens]